MTFTLANSYLPGEFPPPPGPLARYLPVLPVDVATSWLKEQITPGDWILDPFGASPALIAELSQAGYRVLLAANNPIARFLIDLYLQPPGENDYRSALAELAGMSKGNERLEPHIRSLYHTTCEQCHKTIDAQAFIWERGAQAPLFKLYHCPFCDDKGEHPVNVSDVDAALQFKDGGLHRARALERVAPLDDPDRTFAEEALAVYPSRAVYVLFTLINKLESISAAHQRCVHALLLTAFDQANTLWPYPTQRARPRQLTVPARFRENNIWHALEESVDLWIQTAKNYSVPSESSLTTWPTLPTTSSGVCLFEGRFTQLKGLTPHIETIDLKAVVTAIPRPNQAYWTLSTLWAGWLWGREAASSFKNVLRRRRYDWNWHCTALYAALNHLATLVKQGTPMLGLISEAEPGFLSAAILSANLAGFELKNLALRSESAQAQAIWQRAEPQPDSAPTPDLKTQLLSTGIRQKIHRTVENILVERGEPAHYLPLYAAILDDLLRDIRGVVSDRTVESASPGEILSLVQNTIQSVFSSSDKLIRFGASEHSVEIGQWWLLEENKPVSDYGLDHPLNDRVEMAVVQQLIQKAPITRLDLDRKVCRQFSGLQTPEPGIVQACLDSYGELQAPGTNLWVLRTADAPRTRRNDITTIVQLLASYGKRLGFTIGGTIPTDRSMPLPLTWQDEKGDTKAAFYVIASTVIGKIIFSGNTQPAHSLVIYPGGRASLLLFKINTNPRLKQEIDKGWQFVKYRHVRRLVESNQLTRANLTEQFALDPMTQSDAQLTLL